MNGDDTFDCDWTFDRQLADMLGAIVAAEAADLKASATEALRVHDLSMAGIVESLDNLALESGIAKARPKKGKKYPMTGRHRKSGYQRFVAEHFHHVRTHWDESLPPASRRAPRSVEVFSELAIQWRLLWQEDRDQWNCYAKNTRAGPKPTNDLPKVFPTFLEDVKSVESVESPVEKPPEAEMGGEFERAWFDAPRVSRATNGPDEDLAEQSRVGTENFFRMQEGLQLGTSVELK